MLNTYFHIQFIICFTDQIIAVKSCPLISKISNIFGLMHYLIQCCHVQYTKYLQLICNNCLMQNVN